MKKIPNSLIPPKLKHYEKNGTMEQRCRWNDAAADFARYVKRMLRKTGSDTRLDMSDAMVKRRIRAAADHADGIIERYRHLPGLEYEHRDETGEQWIRINFAPVSTYNTVETHAYILYAAAIWILDEILADESKLAGLLKLLPRDDSVIDDLESHAPDVWHTRYQYELIMSVVHVLIHRNGGGPAEKDDENTERAVVASADAAPRGEGTGKRAFDELTALIPAESLTRAESLFEELFWAWTDRYFECVAPMLDALHRTVEKLDRMADEFNAVREELIVETERLAGRRSTPRKPAINPLLANPFAQLDGLPGAGMPPRGPLLRAPMEGPAEEAPFRDLFDITQRLEEISERHSEAVDEMLEMKDKLTEFDTRIRRMGYIGQDDCRERYGEEAARHMVPLRVSDPMEVCFALVWLADRGSDLPWLYGCGSALMEEVSESLPWGIYEYDESEDFVWHPEEGDEGAEQTSLPGILPAAENAKKPDWNERKYVPRKNEFEFTRSLAQILCEETGCLLPRDMHLYDGRLKELRRYGVTAKETAALLPLFAALSNARRRLSALNLNENVMSILEDEDEKQEETDGAETEDKSLTNGELAEQLRQCREENKKLRASLHESDRGAREARKDLAELRTRSEAERRELADLRELVFSLETGEQPEEETGDGDETAFPYEVKKETAVFGGHETWLKAIRPMLTGNIRFIERDVNFSVNIVRSADVIWIQPNAMSHSLYYRAVDAARQYKKPVRYFTCASAAGGAAQLMKADMK